MYVSLKIQKTKMDYSELHGLIHSKIIISTADGNYEGVLKFISGQSVIFEHMFELPSRAYLGTMHMLFSNISSYKLLETTAKHFDTTNFDNSEKISNGEFSINERIDNSEVIEIPPGKFFVEYLPVHLKNSCPSDFSIIDTIDSSFFRAINGLSQSDVIGASFHGPNISRSGILTWLSLSTSSCVYILDIEHLGKAAFKEGLKDILESETIVKVIHDCRQVADCMIHLFNIDLKNIFDTQAADYLINMQMCIGERMFKYVNALDSCLFKYLKVPQQFLYNRNKSATLESEIGFFKKRPVSEDFINVLIKSSIYLPLLKQKQEKLLISPYEQAVELYLNSARSVSDSEVRLMQTELSENSKPECLIDNLKKIRFCNIKQPEDSWTKQYREGKVKLPNRTSQCDI